MTAFPYELFFFVAFLIILTYFLLHSQRDVKIQSYKDYCDVFDVEYDGGFEDLFQFFPHSKIKKIQERPDETSTSKSG